MTMPESSRSQGNWTTSQLIAKRQQMLVSAPPNASLAYEPNRQMTPHITVGPVIGLVTDSTARILIETSADILVKCFLTDKFGVQHGMSKQFQAKRPDAFEFEELRAGTYYRVSFDIPVPGLVHSGLTTLSAGWDISSQPARIVVIGPSDHVTNCRMTSDSASLWKSAYARSRKREIDFVLHVGSLLKLYDPKDNTCVFTQAYEEMCVSEKFDCYEKLRDAYRHALTQPHLRHFLANTSNLSIPTKADLLMDVEGTLSWDFTQSMQKAALDVYNEYGRALYASGDAYSLPKHHFHALGELGILMLDTAQPNSAGDLPKLGSDQWADVDFALSSSGYFSNIKALLVCSSEPIAHMSEGSYMRADKDTRNLLRDSWNTTENIAESSLLLSRIFDWKNQLPPGSRQVLLLCGSSCGTAISDIVDLRYRQSGRHPESSRIRQMAVGPIDREPNRVENCLSLSLAGTRINGLGVYHQFRHLGIYSARAYGIVDIASDPANGVTHQLQLVGVKRSCHKEEVTILGSPIHSTTSLGMGWATHSEWIGTDLQQDVSTSHSRDYPSARSSSGRLQSRSNHSQSYTTHSHSTTSRHSQRVY